MNYSTQIPAYGSPRWKDPVAAIGNLPANGNTAGDTRRALDTRIVYSWDGSAWQADASGGGGGDSFTIWQPDNGTSPTADSATDTMDVTSSDTTITITGDASTKTLDFKLATSYLPLAGGTMAGDIDMGGKNLVNPLLIYRIIGGNTVVVLGDGATGSASVNIAPQTGHDVIIQAGGAPFITYGASGILTLQANDNSCLLLGAGKALWGNIAGPVAPHQLFAPDNYADFGSADGGVTLKRVKDAYIGGNIRAGGNLGVGNSAAGSTPGTVVKKIEVFDASGSSLGFIAVYDAIT